MSRMAATALQQIHLSKLLQLYIIRRKEECNDVDRVVITAAGAAKRHVHSNSMKLFTRNRQGFAVHLSRDSRCGRAESHAASVALCELRAWRVLKRIQRPARDCDFATTPIPANQPGLCPEHLVRI